MFTHGYVLGQTHGHTDTYLHTNACFAQGRKDTCVHRTRFAQTSIYTPQQPSKARRKRSRETWTASSTGRCTRNRARTATGTTSPGTRPPPADARRAQLAPPSDPGPSAESHPARGWGTRQPSCMEPQAAEGCYLGDVGFWVERTPVHEAAQRGESLQLQQLIESGACVNQVTVDSITPLHAASLQGQAKCVQLLLAAGAQVDARNIDGSTPLCDACASGSIECVKLLLSYGAKVNPPLYTASPLHEACMSGSSECVRLLIDVGANLEAHDCHFGTPLHVACAREHLDCVKVLLKAGANVNAAKLHETALHHAAKVKNVDLIEMLIEFGGNIYARDNRGKKPSDYTWSSSAPAKCFEYYEKTPLTLSQLCRVSLRKATGVRGLEKIAKLNIPPRLIDYLSYN
ncbi:ankyrin repeat and SOCS box protein 13 [Tupaia chinensis]|uniref:ankyrin repeat and SOCS box protein 13 n=1 Tax=Tupaia chinensis TaxID=246437 RepID=UPI000FFC9B0D|nr:ankyrin repeat and SOCS box protein 13 [Tupaia chinensis]